MAAIVGAILAGLGNAIHPIALRDSPRMGASVRCIEPRHRMTVAEIEAQATVDSDSSDPPPVLTSAPPGVRWLEPYLPRSGRSQIGPGL